MTDCNLYHLHSLLKANGSNGYAIEEACKSKKSHRQPEFPHGWVVAV